MANQLGFVPLTDAPQTCDATQIEWSPSVVPTAVMHAGDAATPTANAFASQTTVPGENDMIAFAPDGRFLFTVAETGSSGALTRLDLQTGAKTILAQRADWNRLDPVKWYAPSGAFAGGASLFDRPEDFDQRDGRIYFSATEPQDDAILSSTPGHPVREGGVYSVNDSGTPHVQQFVALNDPASGALGQQVPGLQFPDNLAIDRKGNVWIHEDIPDDTQATPANVHSKHYRNMQDELWVALPDKNGDGVSDGLYKFANMGNSATAGRCQNEWTGGAFLGDGAFFVNQQHADNPTWKVDLQRGKPLQNG